MIIDLTMLCSSAQQNTGTITAPKNAVQASAVKPTSNISPYIQPGLLSSTIKKPALKLSSAIKPSPGMLKKYLKIIAKYICSLDFCYLVVALDHNASLHKSILRSTGRVLMSGRKVTIASVCHEEDPISRLTSTANKANPLMDEVIEPEWEASGSSSLKLNFDDSKVDSTSRRRRYNENHVI
jgi:hypothetical protein